MKQMSFVGWERQHHAGQSFYDRLWADLRVGLRQQQLRRLQRAVPAVAAPAPAVAAAAAIENNIRTFSEPFPAFQERLRQERIALFTRNIFDRANYLLSIPQLPPAKPVRASSAPKIPPIKKQVVKFCPRGHFPTHCPTCHSENIRLTESLTFGTCDDCGQNFSIRYFTPKQKQEPKKAMSSDEFWSQMKSAGLIEG